MQRKGQLGNLKAIDARDKLLQKINDLNPKRIQNRIRRDLQDKQAQYKLLEDGVAGIKASRLREEQELRRKQRRL